MPSAIYESNLCDLRQKLNSTKTDRDKFNCLKEFGMKFPLFGDLLVQLKGLCEQFKKNFTQETHFMNFTWNSNHAPSINWNDLIGIRNTLNSCESDDGQMFAEYVLSYPHQHLRELLDMLIFYSVKPISKETMKNYEKSLIHFKELKECGVDDDDKWILCMEKLKDDEAIIANIEYRLDQENKWKNKKLWDYLINFAKEESPWDILTIYARFTRIFIDNKNAVEDYRDQIDRNAMVNAPVTQFWIDTIEYELEYGELEAAHCLLERALKSVVGIRYKLIRHDKESFLKKLKNFEIQMEKVESDRREPKWANLAEKMRIKPKLHFQGSSTPQQLSFHENLIFYILKSAYASLLKKLYSSCKFFFTLLKAPLCYKLSIHPTFKSSYCAESLFINDNNFAGLKNIFVYEFFIFRFPAGRNSLSTIIPKIFKCTVHFLFIEGQDIAFNELKFLLSPNIERIQLEHTDIFQDNTKLPRKTLLKHLDAFPKLHLFHHITSSSFICISSRDRNSIFICFNSVQQFQHEVVDIRYQQFSVLHLHRLIISPNIKGICIIKCQIADANGNLMNKMQIRDIILAQNPYNLSCLDVFC